MNVRSRIVAAGMIWVGSALPAAFGQTVAPAPAPPPRSEAVAASAARNGATGRLNLDTLSTTVGPKAIIKLGGVAAPGLEMTLDGSASSGGKVWYRWLQTQGPKAVLRSADQVVAQFVVPEGATMLGFVLVVGNSVGIDARSVQIDLEDTERDADSQPLKADAGADQFGTVGRRVVLDGTRSEPQGRVRFRWVQMAGPRIKDLAATGATCSFYPEAVGSYQFALLVLGANDLVSEVSLVKVKTKAGQAKFTEPATTERPPQALDELARTLLISIDGGANYGDALARTFDVVADRIDSYKTYLETATDMSLRIDAVVPRDHARRDEWTEQFFKPWTARVTETMRSDKLDLSVPEGQNKPLTKAQRTQLAEQLRFTAAGLRSARSLR